jgi:hypothetical protein
MRKLTIIHWTFVILMLSSITLMGQPLIWIMSSADESMGFDEFGVLHEQPQADILMGYGYDVEFKGDDVGDPGDVFEGALTDEQILELSMVPDLIIFSRGANSGDFNDPAGWNQVTKPIIMSNPYLCRTTRLGWLNTSAMIDDGGAPLMYVTFPEHPIFAGVAVDANNEVDLLDPSVASGNTSFGDVTDPGNGILLSTQAGSDILWIVEWPEGDFYFADGDQFAMGPRLYFPFCTREAGDFGWGIFNLNDEGIKIFVNAVNYMLEQGGYVLDAVENRSADPQSFALMQNYPNPFNPDTEICYSISRPGHINLSVFNLMGEIVATLVDSRQEAGTHRVTFHAGNLANGIYAYQLRTEEGVTTRRMVFMK